MCPVDKLCEDIMQDIADAGYRPALGYGDTRIQTKPNRVVARTASGKPVGRLQDVACTW
jgi:hypothetical protein